MSAYRCIELDILLKLNHDARNHEFKTQNIKFRRQGITQKKAYNILQIIYNFKSRPLILRQEAQVPTGYDTRCLAPQTVWSLWTRDKFLSFTRIEPRFSGYHPHNIVSVLIHTSYDS